MFFFVFSKLLCYNCLVVDDVCRLIIDVSDQERDLLIGNYTKYNYR